MTLGITVSLIVATLLLFILVLSLCARHAATRDVRILNEIARKYDGKISVDSFKTSATLDFQHRGANIRFYQLKGVGGKPTRSCLRCNLNYSTLLSLHIGNGISGDTSIAELRSLMRMPRISVGSERFSQEFSVRGNNQSFLNALLAGEAEKQLMSLVKYDPVLFLYPKGETGSRVNESTKHLVEFSLKTAPRQKEDLENVIERGLLLIRRFLGAASQPA